MKVVYFTERERRLAAREWENYLCSVLRKCAAIENVAKFLEQSLSDRLRPRPNKTVSEASVKDTATSPAEKAVSEEGITLQDGKDPSSGTDDTSGSKSRPKTATGVTQGQQQRQPPLTRSKTSCSQANKGSYPSQRVRKLIRFSLANGDVSKSYLNEGEEEGGDVNSAMTPSVTSVNTGSHHHNAGESNKQEGRTPRLSYTRSQTWQNSSIVAHGNPQMSTGTSSTSAPNVITGCPSGTFVTALNELRQKMTSSSDSQIASLTSSPNPAQENGHAISDSNTADPSAVSFQTTHDNAELGGEQVATKKPGQKQVTLVLKRVGIQEGGVIDRVNGAAAAGGTTSSAHDDSSRHSKGHLQAQSQSAPINSIRERTNSLRQNALLNLQLALQTARRYNNSVPDQCRNTHTSDNKENNVSNTVSNTANNQEETVYSLKGNYGSQSKLAGSGVPLRSLLDLPVVDNVPNNKTGMYPKSVDLPQDAEDETFSRVPYDESLLMMREGIKLLRLRETQPSVGNMPESSECNKVVNNK